MRNLVYSIFVEGEPKAQPRPRKGKYGNFYNPSTADAWKQTVQAAFLVQGKKPMIQGRAIISISFFFHKSTGLGGKVTPKTTKPDADNLLKPVMDALTKISIWKDDCQVDISGVERFWTPGKSGAGIRIEMEDADWEADEGQNGETFICAECGQEITDEYYTYLDNHLQRNYFDDPKDNIFCSKECAAKATMLESLFMSIHGKPDLGSY
ncbi:MAG: hypothetical protein Pg6C_16730 [Treponemataceae bacterium]|nr:MAG: hypothetical protein Pg6C_16730 [Treponemataceae bacterium]